jgi:uncharacterized repeat protein (TIGR01451 family)
MKAGLLALVAAGLAAAAGCAAQRPDNRLYARNVARADYQDPVTRRTFTDETNPVKVEVQRFAALTGVSSPISLTISTPANAAEAAVVTRGVDGARRVGEAIGQNEVQVARDLGVPTPVTGLQPTGTLARDLEVARMTSEASTLRYATWREALAAEGRRRAQEGLQRVGAGLLVQWPGGLHEIDTRVGYATILANEFEAGAKTPIVLIDFSTRLDQRPQMVLSKKADRERAYVDDVITYTITYFNDSPVEAANVLFADIVDENCEYRPESEKCAAEHTFELTRTMEQKPLLVWRLKDPVAPHQGGTITYQLVVRKPFVR